MKTQKLLQEIKSRLAAVYGTRLRGVLLYGSEARGEARTDSDIDVAVLLDGPIEFGLELERIIHALYPLQLESDRIIDARPVDVRRFEQQNFAFYRNVRREGVAL